MGLGATAGVASVLSGVGIALAAVGAVVGIVYTAIKKNNE